ncbi:hypothetical protein [Burkholderia cenocepacia]|uniref:hypothetical protein n=1 Tax=Burkholderia cenocepacia TaxID=95486 RepID=UPI002AB2A010|nr:hypothetical protein [Burkholderia cenocepacia]
MKFADAGTPCHRFLAGPAARQWPAQHYRVAVATTTDGKRAAAPIEIRKRVPRRTSRASAQARSHRFQWRDVPLLILSRDNSEFSNSNSIMSEPKNPHTNDMGKRGMTNTNSEYSTRHIPIEIKNPFESDNH